jgi:hypothetical protein
MRTEAPTNHDCCGIVEPTKRTWLVPSNQISTLEPSQDRGGLQPPGLEYFLDMAQDEDKEKLLPIQEYFSKEGKNRDR